MNLGKLVVLVFIDLKKAFDTVDHDILCKKLQLYGVQKRELSWFKSYLSNWKQFGTVSGIDSKTGDMEVGVPQGSFKSWPSSFPHLHQWSPGGVLHFG